MGIVRAGLRHPRTTHPRATHSRDEERETRQRNEKETAVSVERPIARHKDKRAGLRETVITRAKT